MRKMNLGDLVSWDLGLSRFRSITLLGVVVGKGCASDWRMTGMTGRTGVYSIILEKAVSQCR